MWSSMGKQDKKLNARAPQIDKLNNRQWVKLKPSLNNSMEILFIDKTFTFPPAFLEHFRLQMII